MSRPLVIGSDERASIEALKASAGENFRQGPSMADLTHGLEPPAPTTRRGFIAKGQTLALPGGYHVGFAWEMQPTGIVRHLSLAVDAPGHLPAFAAILLVLEAFDFRVARNAAARLGDAEKVINEAALRGALFVWAEEYEPGQLAMNVLEPVDA